MRTIMTCAVLVLGACSPATAPSDTGNTNDAATSDDRAVSDVQTLVDSATPIDVAEPPDAGAEDAGVDSGAMDTGPIDTGLDVVDVVIDTGPIDAGAIDASALDAGPLDAGGMDAGPRDTGALVDAGADVRTNAPPVVGNVVAPSSGILGQRMALSVSATDPDGDRLTYTWTQTAPTEQGIFTAPSAASTEWMSAAAGAQVTATVQVSVSDGVNAPVTRTAMIRLTVPTFANDVQPIFTANCTGCHGFSAGMSLAAGVSYRNLVNVMATTVPCNSMVRVQPGSLTGSALAQRIAGTACGSRMPRSNPAFFVDNPDRRVAIESWILAGALNN